MIVQAIVYRPVRIATRLGVFGQILHAAVPRIAQIVMNTTFRMFPDSDRAKGDRDGARAKATPDQIALANADARRALLTGRIGTTHDVRTAD